MHSAKLRPAYAGVLTERRDAVRAHLEELMPPDNSPFLWEVGCGHGHFLTAYAAAHPEKLCLGVDLASERIARAEKKRQRAGLTNLHFIRADARLFLEALPPAAMISELFILFPDPWPKSRHHKHRVLQPRFLEQVAAHTAPGCQLYFRTDHAPYFSDAQRVVSASTQWELVAEPWPFEFETVFQRRAKHHESLIARRRNP